MRKEANAVEDGGSNVVRMNYTLTCVADLRPRGAGKLVPQKHGAIFDGHASITS